MSADDRRLGAIGLAIVGLNGHSARRLVRLSYFGIYVGHILTTATIMRIVLIQRFQELPPPS